MINIIISGKIFIPQAECLRYFRNFFTYIDIAQSASANHGLVRLCPAMVDTVGW